MRRHKPARWDKKHPEAAREAMEENDIRYMEPNRDRALGEADRTGRHFDEDTTQEEDEGTEASEQHEAD
jgi:hypothetical protein